MHLDFTTRCIGSIHGCSPLQRVPRSSFAFLKRLKKGLSFSLFLCQTPYTGNLGGSRGATSTGEVYAWGAISMWLGMLGSTIAWGLSYVVAGVTLAVLMPSLHPLKATPKQIFCFLFLSPLFHFFLYILSFFLTWWCLRNPSRKKHSLKKIFQTQNTWFKKSDGLGPREREALFLSYFLAN